jgi:hypothetical protein
MRKQGIPGSRTSVWRFFKRHDIRLFDPTINYGHVLTALSIVIAGTGAYYGMSVELHNVDQHVAKIEATLQQLANVVVRRLGRTKGSSR